MRWLIQKLAKTVTIQVSPERFAFHYNGNSVSFATRVWLNGYRIVGVGSHGPAGSEAIELFGDRFEGSKAPNRSALLEAVVHYGIRQVIGKGIYIRPILQFEGLSSFEAILGGYQEAVFGQAVESFPVGDVRFS